MKVFLRLFLFSRQSSQENSRGALNEILEAVVKLGSLLVLAAGITLKYSAITESVASLPAKALSFSFSLSLSLLSSSLSLSLFSSPLSLSKCEENNRERERELEQSNQKWSAVKSLSRKNSERNCRFKLKPFFYIGEEHA